MHVAENSGYTWTHKHLQQYPHIEIWTRSQTYKVTYLLSQMDRLIYMRMLICSGFSGSSDGKESARNAGDLGLVLGQEDPLEKGMATHSSIIAWRIPRIEEPGGLQSMESQSRTRLRD